MPLAVDPALLRLRRQQQLPAARRPVAGQAARGVGPEHQGQLQHRTQHPAAVQQGQADRCASPPRCHRSGPPSPSDPVPVPAGRRADDRLTAACARPTPSDPYNGQMSYVQAADATTLDSRHRRADQQPLGVRRYGLGAVDDGTGLPVTAGAYSSTDHITVHHGIETVPPPTPGSPDVAARAHRRRRLQRQRGPRPEDRRDVRDLVLLGQSTRPTRASVQPRSGRRTGAPMAPAPLSTVQFQGADRVGQRHPGRRHRRPHRRRRLGGLQLRLPEPRTPWSCGRSAPPPS